MNAPKASVAVLRRNRLAYARVAALWRQRLHTDYDHEFHKRCRTLFLEALTGERVLEVGCGLGLDSLAFASHGLKVVATDLALEFLRGIRAENQDLRLAAMDLTQPCFKPASFDGIFACACLLHVPPELTGNVIRGFADLLAPGAVLFIHHVASRRGLDRYTVEHLLTAGNPAFCFCHTEEELTRLLRQAGLHVLGWSYLAPRRHPSPCAERYWLEPYQIVAQKPQPTPHAPDA